MIVIAHRLSTVRRADRIVVLESGRDAGLPLILLIRHLSGLRLAPTTGPQSQAETTARTVTPSRSIPSSSEVCVFGRENLTTSHVGCQDTSRKDLVVRDGHDVLRKNYEVRELAGLD